MNQTPPKALREMGADFTYAADALSDTMRHLEQGKNARLKFLHSCITDETDRLAKLKEEVRTLPEQIGKWEAERARLESQTAEDLLRQALGAVILHPQPPGEVIEAPLTQPQPEPYRAGLPPERLRKVWAEWEVLERGEPVDLLLVFSTDGRLCKWADGREWFAVVEGSTIWDGRSMRPHGKTRAEVEAMADEAEKPTLLDLTKLPPGTVCEASDFFPIYNSGRMIHAGDRFRVVELSDGDLPVLIKVSGKDWWSSALVPAIVVEPEQGAGQ